MTLDLETIIILKKLAIKEQKYDVAQWLRDAEKRHAELVIEINLTNIAQTATDADLSE